VRVTVDGLEFFGTQPWVREIPLMTIAYGWGNDEFQDEDDDEDSDASDTSDTEADPDEELDNDNS
jgi:hypothetical protein